MTDPEPPAEPPASTGAKGKQWVWFVGLLTAMDLLGLAAAVVLMLPLAMATDGCHDGTTDKVCQLTAAGQNTLLLIPWICLVVGNVTAIAGAAFAEWRKWTPLIGIPVGILGYFATIPIGYWLAFAV